MNNVTVKFHDSVYERYNNRPIDNKKEDRAIPGWPTDSEIQKETVECLRDTADIIEECPSQCPAEDGCNIL